MLVTASRLHAVRYFFEIKRYIDEIELDDNFDIKVDEVLDYIIDQAEIHFSEFFVNNTALNVELIVLAGYLAIVSEKLINLYENRIMNIHPSLIPSFCGPGFYGIHVHEHAFNRGVKVSGATVHFVSEEVDGGR